MQNKCKSCGYEWDSKKQDPKSCPYCKSYKWKDKNNNPNLDGERSE